MSTLSVGLVHNIISPYRVPLFEELAARPNVELEVYYCSETHDHREWEVPESDGYDYEVLSGVHLDTDRFSFNYHVNPGIVSRVFRANHDVVLIGGTGDFTTQAAYATAWLTDTPVVLWSEQIASTQSLVNYTTYPIKRHIVRNSAAMVVPGRRSKEFHVGLGAAPEKIHFAPNVIDNESYLRRSATYECHADELKRAHDVDTETILLFVGQLIRRKGLEYLVEAYKSLRTDGEDVALVVVGDGHRRDALEARVEAAALNDVTFTGWVSERQKQVFYAMADVFVLPTREDLAPLVVNEAMASGLPVVTTDAVGSADDMILKGENGHVVPAEDAMALYRCLSRVIGDHQTLATMGRRSRKLMENRFTVERSVDGFVEAIEYAAERGPDD